MSLYNALFGSNPLAGMLMEALELKPEDVGRFRDCYLTTDEETNEPRIVVFTRNGGGNRDDYAGTFDRLQAHPLYVSDRDEDYDSTYASIVFKTPPEITEAAAGLLAQLATENPDLLKTPLERFADLVEKLKQGKSDPEVAHAIEVGTKILAPLKDPK